MSGSACNKSPDETSSKRERIAESLIDAAQGGLPGPMSPYITRHLAGHIGDARAWRQLAGVPEVLDRLEPRTVAEEVLKSAFGRSDLPSEILATAGEWTMLSDAALDDRAIIRALAMA